MDQDDNSAPADAVPNNWVDRLAPPRLRPWLRLTRLDRPIGAWLLFWPGWWSLALAARHAPGLTAPPLLPDPWLLAAFFLGAFLMRGAGCTYNDIIDRDIDARIERTRRRPLPSGAVSVRGAVVWLVIQALAGLAILLTFNDFAIGLGAASLLIVAIYPFAKRITYWPQFVLGLAFNWGALLGWAATTGGLSPAALALYAGGIAWTLAYDTIYAHQDRRDDSPAGVKSSALKLGRATKPWLAVFFAFLFAMLVVAGRLGGTGGLFYPALLLPAAHAVWQLRTLDIDRPANCLARFRANHLFGGLVFVAIIAGNLYG